MPIIDGDRDEIVIRIVYDGPPLAGKTTSLVALAGMLPAGRRSEVFTPGAAQGRTLYFDWVDYLGGWFDGLQVRCQIVSVPGQRSLVDRRHALLREADAVVFVAESTPEGADVAVSYYEGLRGILPSDGNYPVPVVLQANKQDLAEALSPDELRARLPDERYLAIIGSAAASAQGVKEAFTFAVRLALDRVRVLAKDSRLRVGEPSIRSGADLLEAMLAEEHDSHARPSTGEAAAQAKGTGLGVAARSALGRSPASQESAESPSTDLRNSGAAASKVESDDQRAAGAHRPPALPNSQAPSGLVWPPMAGRIVLRELESDAAVADREPDGSWTCTAAGRWRLVSEAALVFDDMESGRRRLVESARRHTALEPILSEQRALVLAETGDERWRLWKIVRIERSLADSIEAALDRQDGAKTASSLFRAADALLAAERLFRDLHAPLPVALGTVGISDGQPQFIGIVPENAHSNIGDSKAIVSEELVRQHFAPYIERARGLREIDAPAALNELREILRKRPERMRVIEAIAAMLIGH